MTASALLHNNLLPLTLAHTGKEAFHWMGECHVQHLPVVDEKKLVGVLSEEDLFNHSLFDQLKTYDFSIYPLTFVHADDHVFDVIRVMGENRLTTVPVVNSDGHYLGLVTQDDLVHFLSENASFAEPGGIITLQIAPRDYVLSEICRLIEEEDAKVLSTFVTSNYQSDTLELTVKVNRTDLSRIVASLVRHEYNVKNTFGYDQSNQNYQERFDSLMHYLNM